MAGREQHHVARSELVLAAVVHAHVQPPGLHEGHVRQLAAVRARIRLEIVRPARADAEGDARDRDALELDGLLLDPAVHVRRDGVEIALLHRGERHLSTSWKGRSEKCRKPDRSFGYYGVITVGSDASGRVLLGRGLDVLDDGLTRLRRLHRHEVGEHRLAQTRLLGAQAHDGVRRHIGLVELHEGPRPVLDRRLAGARDALSTSTRSEATTAMRRRRLAFPEDRVQPGGEVRGRAFGVAVVGPRVSLLAGRRSTLVQRSSRRRLRGEAAAARSPSSA
jgi:hypothetical protein